MHDVMKIDVKENIHSENDHIAEHVKAHLSEDGVLVVNVMGAPGVGKTTTLKNIFKNLNTAKPYVIEGDIESDLDTAALQKLGITTVQINTHGACHLDAPSIQTALRGVPDLRDGVLFIENIGNLVCPAEFTIGEHAKMLIVSTTDGSDKPYKYPLAFEKADLIVLNKNDLTPYLDFDYDFFEKGVLLQNKHATVIRVSARTDEGFDDVAAWIERARG